MENPMLDTMANAMQEQFKKEVQKREDIIRGLSSQEQNTRQAFNLLQKDYDDLSKRYEAKQQEFLKLDSVLVEKKSKFDASNKATTDALDTREKKIEDNETQHQLKVDNLVKEETSLNTQKEEFRKLKLDLIDELSSLNVDVDKTIKNFTNKIN